MSRFILPWLALQIAVFAQEPIVTHLEFPGRITWTNAVNTNALYRVEWASSLQGPWNFAFDSLGGGEFRSIQGGTNTRFSAAVPMFFRVCMITSTPPVGMVMVPGGGFQMGNHFGAEADPDQLPVHDVELSPFWITPTEITRSEWNRVLEWGLAHGYEFATTNRFSEPDADQPVVMRSWYDAAKWCNARSEMEDRYPAYWFPDGMFAMPLRSGESATVDFWRHVDGYRMPTEAEWEYAARGGLSGRRFPYGDTIGHAQENYESTGAYAYDISTTSGYHPAFSSFAGHYAPVGRLSPNGYGLYDMAGNASEMCSDRYANNYYGWGVVTNPTGPAGTAYPYRIARGGCSVHDASVARVAVRIYLDPADPSLYTFRIVTPLQ